MKLPKSENAKLISWLEKQEKKIENWKSDINSNWNKLDELKTDLGMLERLIDLINDIDNESDRELVERAYQTEITEEQDNKVSEIKDLENEIDAINDKIAATNILIQKFHSDK